MATQLFFGPTISTDNLHNTNIAGRYDSSVYGEYANSWFKKYELRLSLPAGWHFIGEPTIQLIGPGPDGNPSQQDAIDGFRWNNFPGAHDRAFITQRTPTLIVMTCWAGSHSMLIALACQGTTEGNFFQNSGLSLGKANSGLTLSQDEMGSLNSAKEKEEALPGDLKQKVEAMVVEFSKLPKKDDDVCCKYYTGGPKYMKTSQQNCDSINGEVVDSSNCP